MTPKQQQLTELLQPSVVSLGLILWAIEIVGRANRTILRLVIDHSGRSVTVEDCEAVSRQVSRILDVNDPLLERYTLEVSSPGIERTLYRLEHYEPFVGYQAKVKLRVPFEERKNYLGMISGVRDQAVLLQQGGIEYEFPVEQIERGQLVVTDFEQVGGSKNGK
ncbi:MAG TPA: ribosome maturation factor RimP [Gammaproteobacteria bacterium]|nr:ribosome maturation factor RimP [Gammaproteobacteria bacterium]